jgi:F0F1-type ATP synthase assembly protein I
MADRPEDETAERSALGILRDVVLSLTQIAENSAELLSATVREELQRFRVEMARHAITILAFMVGGVLLTIGLAMYLRQLIGSWPLTLCLLGALCLVIAGVLQRKSK